jgi:hypothetical protein
MRRFPILLFIMIVFLQSCGPNEREKLKQEQEAAILKEQELAAWEQRLKAKELELDIEQNSLDSAKKQIDSVPVYNAAIIGKWNVKMSCTETNCDGSAIGDTKNEQWYISYDENDNKILVKAYSGPVLIRTYVGTYQNNALKIVDEKPNPDALIGATLNFINDTRMDGVREIKQTACKIVYELNARKVK